ncbi:MAG: NAD(P)/FAD-dependent oxidoreductase [Planctomycetes bacterium]|nr:NAD(P)/FAD-dependent oxidoreductase [Planctomycetota bacterium]
MAETVVIGAGPAGLTTAFELNKLGQKSVILEADRVVGGISRTVNHNGFRFDIGGHRFFSKVTLINDLWKEILDDEFLERPRMSRIFYRGKYFDYPLKAFNALSGLGPIEAARCMASYAKARVFPKPDPQSFEDWVANRFGYRLYSIFFKTYTEKVWGIPCKDISADWAAQRIKNLSLSEAIRNALFPKKGPARTKDGQVITTLIDTFHYPRYGPGQMWEACQRRLSQAACPTVYDAPVERVRHTNGRVECVLPRGVDGSRGEYSGSHFVSSMPLRELILAMDPPPPPEVLAAASRLRYRDYLTVVLVVNKPEMFPDNWIYIHAPEVKVGRVQNYKSWSPAMVPNGHQCTLGLEYFLWDKDEEWTWPDDRLIELGIRESEQIGLIRRSDVAEGVVVRMAKAYPIYDRDYRATVDVLQRYLRTFNNLQTIGRNGQHRYNNQDHSMLTGVFAARNIAGGNYAAHDIWSVNVEQEYHEHGKVVQTKTAPVDRLVPSALNSSGSGAPR